MARVSRSEDGFTVRGIAPPALRAESPAIRQVFWQFALAEVLAAKDAELARGLGASGRPLRPISSATRKHRRSAMTPTGRGDPKAPPLTPGYALSRTRSLLSGRAFPDRVEIFWAYDPLTYDSWARILEYQAKRGRDVFGLSPAALARATSRSWRAFALWQAGRRHAPTEPPPVVQPSPAGAREAPMPPIGTEGAAAGRPGPMARPWWASWVRRPAPAAPRAGEPKTWRQWREFLRKPAPAPTPAGPGTRRGPFNVLLRMMFGP